MIQIENEPEEKKDKISINFSQIIGFITTNLFAVFSFLLCLLILLVVLWNVQDFTDDCNMFWLQQIRTNCMCNWDNQEPKTFDEKFNLNYQRKYKPNENDNDMYNYYIDYSRSQNGTINKDQNPQRTSQESTT